MELELLGWSARRWIARPWLVLSWLILVALVALLPGWSRLGIRSEALSYQIVMAEAALLWGVLGGISVLSAWAEIEPQLAALGAQRRWRVRGTLAVVLLWIPAIPILGLGVLLSEGAGTTRTVLVAVALLAQSTLTVWLAERIPWASVRSFVFVALAWWVPALASAWPFGSSSWMQRFEIERAGSNFNSDSAVWQAWVGSMLTLAFLTLALDLVHRPHHEVRHPR